MREKQSCKMSYVVDEKGEEMLLKEGKFQVMMQWEKPYMEACIDALQPFGDVLEIGFGCGYSASHIQTYFPKSHTIVEFHPEVIEKARRWASHYTNIHIIEDIWQNALSKLGIFDAIFFDDYPLESEQEMKALKEEEKKSALWIQSAEELLQSVHTALPELTQIRYTDADLLAFLEERRSSEALELYRFFKELCSRRQITEGQLHFIKQRMLERGLLSGEVIAAKKEPSKSPFSFEKKGDRLFTFLEQCLQDHMRKGSRFSCFLNDPTSKYQDKVWFDKIITNPFLDYIERRIPVEVPQHCHYYSSQEALVVTIEKK